MFLHPFPTLVSPKGKDDREARATPPIEPRLFRASSPWLGARPAYRYLAHVRLLARGLLLHLLLLLPLLLTLPRPCYSCPDPFGSAMRMCIHTPIAMLARRRYRAQYLSKASRGKLDTRRAVQLRVPRQACVANAVVLQVGEGNVAVERAEQVLRSHAVTRLVEENRHELVRPVLIGRLLCHFEHTDWLEPVQERQRTTKTAATHRYNPSAAVICCAPVHQAHRWREPDRSRPGVEEGAQKHHLGHLRGHAQSASWQLTHHRTRQAKCTHRVVSAAGVSAIA
jgi:hypothetical protein